MAAGAASPSQGVPAWKRLGLKLKQGPDAAESTHGSSADVGHRANAQQQQQSNKRKFDAPPAVQESQGAKKPRKDDQTPQKKQKTVSFGDTPSKNDITPGQQTQKRPKKSKGPAKKQTAPSTDLKPALEYLRHWHSSRGTWKFNKNHQSTVIRHVFDDADTFPAADAKTFYEYIRDLKGFVRTRLRETAMEVRMTDEADGTSGFPQGTDDVSAKQERYEAVLTKILQAHRLGDKRKLYDEVAFVASSEDGEAILRRIVKRMRAEMILDELSDASETDTSTTTTSSSETVMADDDTKSIRQANGDKRAKMNDGSGKRKRKLRTNMDDSSSSESETDSDSDTSSSGSSDDDSDNDDDDDEMKDGEADSSSSSSSSSSEDDSDSEADSDEEDES